MFARVSERERERRKERMGHLATKCYLFADLVSC